MCNALIQVEIPYSVTHIGEGAFSNCDNLAGVVIPSSVVSIDADAFADCEVLILVLEKNSFAHKYAIENELNFVLIKPLLGS